MRAACSLAQLLIAAGSRSYDLSIDTVGADSNRGCLAQCANKSGTFLPPFICNYAIIRGCFERGASDA